MNPTDEVLTLSRVLRCAHCNRIIKTDELVHLRDSCALPEEPTHHVHRSCAGTFIEERPGRWETIDRDSIDAGWFFS